MRKVPDIPSMRFYRAKQAAPVFTRSTINYVTKPDWRVDAALALVAAVLAFIVTCWVML